MPEMHDSRGAPAASRLTVLELRVRNHPGAMSHITGLFARRAFNLEAILCVPDPAGAGATSTASPPRLANVATGWPGRK